MRIWPLVFGAMLESRRRLLAGSQTRCPAAVESVQSCCDIPPAVNGILGHVWDEARQATRSSRHPTKRSKDHLCCVSPTEATMEASKIPA